jgi:hypothetical protein
MAADLKPIEDQVTAIEGVVPSVVTLINGLAAYIVEHKNDPVAIQNYADRLSRGAVALGDAVAANPLPS